MRLKLKKREGNGEAYALLKFEHEKDINDIERELYELNKNKEEYGIPQELYIYVVKTSPSDVHADLKKHADWEYILKAILPGATNEDAANELSHATNQLYRGVELRTEPSDVETGKTEYAEVNPATNKYYHEIVHIKHDKVHYEDKGRHYHLRKNQKVHEK